jgi:hypothetical protein
VRIAVGASVSGSVGVLVGWIVGANVGVFVIVSHGTSALPAGLLSFPLYKYLVPVVLSHITFVGEVVGKAVGRSIFWYRLQKSAVAHGTW